MYPQSYAAFSCEIQDIEYGWIILAILCRPVAIVDISTYRTIYGYERDHFWCRDILRLIIFFIIKNNDYINFYIKMNITNILVDRATSVISSALCGGGGA